MTPTEKYVYELTQHSFLTLWCYPNPKGKNDKELCDILVFCEPHIILISVKEIKPTNSGNIDIDWQRWKKTALEKSFRQLYGAERYLNSINQLKLFDRSSGPKLPHVKDRIYHRVAIVTGGEKKMPLLWGDLGKGFVHVFDSITAEIIFTELNTITDFTEYLTKKEEFYNAGNFSKLIFEGGEEDLLAFYLSNSEEFKLEGTLTILTAGLWDRYKISEVNLQWMENIKYSVVWDNMIEVLIKDYQNNKMEIGKEYENFELVMRTMARESRYNRIILSKEFLEAYNKNNIRAHSTTSYSGLGYIFMFVNRDESREYIRSELVGRCLIIRKYTPEINTIIGIATEKKDGKKGFSLNVVYFYKSTLSEQEKSKADELIKKYGWYKKSSQLVTQSKSYA